MLAEALKVKGWMRRAAVGLGKRQRGDGETELYRAGDATHAVHSMDAVGVVKL